ncbi:uncharacterized protein LOC111829903 [Capsella rubella]|uniref:uncharacterized protein LOC111829903 n=1 Tax=Capsella rubella TaxID=81985 RepID=UPI000CD4CF8F|nr:uncharacterized protein LOC111829903 [Capsella rubella]
MGKEAYVHYETLPFPWSPFFYEYNVMERENDAQVIVKPTHMPFPKPKSHHNPKRQ